MQSKKTVSLSADCEKNGSKVAFSIFLKQELRQLKLVENVTCNAREFKIRFRDENASERKLGRKNETSFAFHHFKFSRPAG